MENNPKKSKKRDQAPACTLLETCGAEQARVKKTAPDLQPLRLTRIFSQTEDALSNP